MKKVQSAGDIKNENRQRPGTEKKRTLMFWRSKSVASGLVSEDSQTEVSSNMGLKSFLIAGATAYSLLVTQLIAAETLTVVIQNIEKEQGTIMVQIMAGESEFKGLYPEHESKGKSRTSRPLLQS